MQNSSLKDIVIVLVEDDDTLCRMYQTKLESDGFTVFTANNGADGFKLIEEHKPAIVLCDIMMPGTNGLQLLQMKSASHDEAVRSIPVIMLTNLTEEEYKLKAEELGAIHFFYKGQDEPRNVVIKIKEVLGLTSVEATAEAA
ncbi:MAG: response regulator [Candidatus Doudnabacteria bacterium]|nr:response regulator [Candidatus Doudnabacteria bacterium]